MKVGFDYREELHVASFKLLPARRSQWPYVHINQGSENLWRFFFYGHCDGCGPRQPFSLNLL